MSIDSEHNVWISLYDRYTALKYNSSLQTLLASAVPTFFNDLEEFDEGSPLIAPPIAETDKENDVWICYSHPVSSCLLKFDSNGNYAATAENLPFDSVPVSLAITKQNNVWVACREKQIKCAVIAQAATFFLLLSIILQATLQSIVKIICGFFMVIIFIAC